MKLHGIDLATADRTTLLSLIREESRRMLSLLDGPEPGLFTWSKCILTQLQLVQGYIAGVLGTNGPVKFMELDTFPVTFSRAPQSDRLAVTRAVDVTGLCPLRTWNVYLIYVLSGQRRGVVIRDGDTEIKFWLDELDAQMHLHTHMGTLWARANMFGLSTEGLRAIIDKYIPAE